jgi:hypothetical protein
MDPQSRDRDRYRPLPPGFEPTGKTIDITVLDVVRIEEGRVAGHRGVADQLEVALRRACSARLASRALTRTAARPGQASPPHTGITWSRACPATSG